MSFAPHTTSAAGYGGARSLAPTMSSIFTTTQYWFVNHPYIINFSWKQDRTFGSSHLFLALTVLSYLAVTSLLYYAQLSVKPQLLRAVTAVHNLVLFTLSLAMTVGCVLSSISHAPSLHWIICFPKNTPPSGPVFFWAYVFYLSKILEFVDTFLIILSGSIRRLSFLHVYHHATVVIMCYVWLNTSQSFFPVALTINTSVHVLMYSYYFLCSVGVRPKWKKLVTHCQIGQFWFSFLAFGLVLYCHFTGLGCSGILGCGFNMLFCASLLVLFIDFYSRNYVKLKPKGA
ncbi:elongation of fatty acids protein 3-like [Rhodamnia argentea]|uniref:very-long-chain 3-oxoacyl-CoA synthase n=1 Tax=Rhodamnia argentea TaxID=178133 RepID=A0A8B8PX10_9MYRT|nr:elongation of fatty acids protein 3-like [Rhodamnia argentea]